MHDIPAADAGDFDWLFAEQSAVLTVAQAKAFFTEGIVRGNLRQDRWRRWCRGILLGQNGRLMRDQQLWVAVLVAGDHARLAGPAAATEGGVRGLRAEQIDVLIPADRIRSDRLPRLPLDMPDVRIHRTGVLPAPHQQIGRPPRTTVARAVIDGAAWAGSDNEARDLITRACQQARVTPAALEKVLEYFPKIRRHRLITTTIADVKGGATALSEIDLVRLCRRFHLPAPDLQRLRVDESGRSRYIDAEWTSARLLVEIDGGHHMDVRHWAADMLRQNQIWISGDRILRFPAWLVRSEPITVAHQIRAALIAAGPAHANKPADSGVRGKQGRLSVGG
ncbi:endonuclease domain-containing protein [Actinoplanes sp. KI2]|uniref:endonuclease domain-containing protein n=1 Tax=Actinoplanes sp. KI2 TaxID=2983315 RepID=UPI0021D5EC47|nr:endonuclease domain-containing protein [Actinoplanes sp. KI2]MCU7723556.1 endonuclease domain-containing protein [Actinoplanes sp. KI2]